MDGATGGVSGNTFTAGNASMNTTGFRLTGGPSVTTTGIDAGNTVITNVASGVRLLQTPQILVISQRRLVDLTTNDLRTQVLVTQQTTILQLKLYP